jgi:roadblock/LC7 domain-containing protein
MIKILIASLLLALAAVGCNTDGPVATTGTSVAGKVDPQGKLLQEEGDVSSKTQSFIVRMGDATAKRGDLVCLPVEATGFNDIIGFQFTMRFDSAALDFQKFQATNLPGYSPANFGVRFAERGYLSTLWTDPTLKGLTRPASTPLFEACFLNLMKKGQETDVKFQDGPTSFQAIQTDMSELRFVYANGKVRSK